MLRVRHRHFSAANPLDWNIQIVKRTFHDSRTDFSGNAAAAPSFIDNERAMRFCDRGKERFVVERTQRSQIDHLGFDAFGGKFVRRFERFPQASAVRDDRDVACQHDARAHDRCPQK